MTTAPQAAGTSMAKDSAMLYTASFYAEDDWEGERYRVSRGHPRGRRTQWCTLPSAYPALGLLRRYRSREIDFERLGLEYRIHLDSQYEESEEFRSWVDKLPISGDITLLCFERSGLPCHRLVLARWLLEKVPQLSLGALR
jgi:uncharacterized protein YeaO (DUF488 family)